MQTIGTPDAHPNNVFRMLDVKRGFDPAPASKLRWVYVGELGVGKSTLVASIPDAIIIDPEASQNAVPGARSWRFCPGSRGTNPWTHFQEIMAALISDATSTFKTVVFDTGDSFVGLIERGLTDRHNAAAAKSSSSRVLDSITEFGAEGAGWTKIHNTIKHTLIQLENAGYGWGTTLHTKNHNIKLMDGKEFSFVDAALSPGCAAAFKERADYVGRIILEKKKTTTIRDLDLGDKVMEQEFHEEHIVRTLTFSLPPAPKNATAFAARTVKQRIPFNKEVVLPKMDGWATVVSAYEAAATQAQLEDQAANNKEKVNAEK